MLWTCNKCGLKAKIKRFPVRCVCGATGYNEASRIKLIELESDYRHSVCVGCKEYMKHFRCKKIDLGCSRTFRQWLEDPKKSCPIEQWEKLERPHLSISLQRRKICEVCPLFVEGKCSELDIDMQELVYATSPLCPLGKWTVKWTPVKDEIPEPTSDLLVITVAVGETFEKLLKMTGPRFRSYAEKCGADYFELTGSTQEWWGLEKFRIYPIAKQYSRTLYLDADAMVFSETPNLFDVVPEGHVAMHDDHPKMPYKEWYGGDRELVCRDHGMEFYEHQIAWNTGVVMCDRESAGIWKPPPNQFQPTHCYEQIWVEVQAQQHPFFGLPPQLNWQYWFLDFWEQFADAKLVHLSACHPPARQVLLEGLDRWLSYPA